MYLWNWMIIIVLTGIFVSLWMIGGVMLALTGVTAIMSVILFSDFVLHGGFNRWCATVFMIVSCALFSSGVIG